MMEILFTGVGLVFFTFIISMIFDLDEGGFIITLIVLSAITGGIAVGVSDINETIEEEVAVEETAKKSVQPPLPAPVGKTDNPELRVERREVTQNNCEVVGKINFMCTNVVKLGDDTYTVKVNCDRDPYDGSLDCTIK